MLDDEQHVLRLEESDLGEANVAGNGDGGNIRAVDRRGTVLGDAKGDDGNMVVGVVLHDFFDSRGKVELLDLSAWVLDHRC